MAYRIVPYNTCEHKTLYKVEQGETIKFTGRWRTCNGGSSTPDRGDKSDGKPSDPGTSDSAVLSLTNAATLDNDP